MMAGAFLFSPATSDAFIGAAFPAGAARAIWALVFGPMMDVRIFYAFAGFKKEICARPCGSHFCTQFAFCTGWQLACLKGAVIREAKPQQVL
jgi:hypothetical protein